MRRRSVSSMRMFLTLFGMQAQQTPISLDLSAEVERQVVVDKAPGQYLGHPSTVLLEDGKTILVVYPEGHGKGRILYKKSADGGRTWSRRLLTPKSWETSLETPTIHRVVDPKTGRRRLNVWSGLFPARFSISEDDGATWGELKPAGEWGGIVVMGFVERLRSGDYLAMFHDDGRFFLSRPQATGVFTLYKTSSKDGGLTWSFPEPVYASSDLHLCEPGAIRSPDGRRLAILLRENSRKRNSHVMFSDDEGKTWSQPRALPLELTGDRHIAKYAKDGRLVVSFRDMPPEGGAWKGDWVAWVGTWQDLEQGRRGQYRVRLKDNLNSWDCGYSGVETLADGTLVLTSYGHWTEGEEPYILAIRLRLEELDARARRDARDQDR
ncbi:MAG: exo-alpha-sialidase [Armatimonadetes bacterium]|nr:exo-alpha-sialidase [Armatimonadota bacterium]NOG93210.1 exo-alpha-sialidase [Armatimonadota bacterium]